MAQCAKSGPDGVEPPVSCDLHAKLQYSTAVERHRLDTRGISAAAQIDGVALPIPALASIVPPHA